MKRHGLNLLLAFALLTALPACNRGGGGSDPEPQPGPTVSGAISIPAGTLVDGDVNDPDADLTPNDTVATAQLIASPSMLGGYANQPNAGAPGRSMTGGDVRDYYRVTLATGDSVNLYVMGEGPTDDLDLSLLDMNGVVLMQALEGAVETVTAGMDAEYILEVAAFSGAANYVLSVAAGTATLEAQQPEFVPGELIVRFDMNEVDGPMDELVQGMNLNWDRGSPEEEMLLGCDDAEQRDAAFEALGIGHLLTDDATLSRMSMEDQLVRDTPRLAKALGRRADVQSADLNYIRQPMAVPADEFYGFQWHYPQIKLPAAWDLVQANSGVIVAVIDTGVVGDHPDFTGQLLAGYDFISNPGVAADGDGCDPDPTDPGDGVQPGTSSYHGTHVSGTVAARTSLQVDADTTGVAGVAWNARVMPLRVLGRGGGSDFDVMQAVRYAAGLTNQCNVLPAQRANVINMSLGGAGANAAFAALIQEVRNQGVVVVASAGNAGNDQPMYPASYDGVISVSAVDLNKNLTFYSSFGATVDVTGPGGDVSADLNNDGFADGVLSLFVDDTGPQDAYVYAFFAGTSMSAPHVSGVIALMLGVNNQLTPADIDTLLAAGKMTEDLGNPAFYGAGLIDAQASVMAAIDAANNGVVIDEPRLGVDPVSIRFNPMDRDAVLTAANVGDPNQALNLATVTATTDDGGNWLSVVSINAGADGLGDYRVTVDRFQLTQGTYTGRLNLDSDVNDIEIPITMEVGTLQTANADAGRHYVLMVDSATGATQRSMAVMPSGGRYSFNFAEVATGNYQLMAGSDLDNDGMICEPGEACGAYPTMDSQQTVSVNGSVSGINFATGFHTAPGGMPAQPVTVGQSPN